METAFRRIDALVLAPLRNWLRSVRAARGVRRWRAAGRPCPPPHAVKQRILREYTERFGVDADYPSLDAVRRRVANESPGSSFEVRDDVIRIASRAALVSGSPNLAGREAA